MTLNCHSLTTFRQTFWWRPFPLPNQNLVKVKLTFPAKRMLPCRVNPELFNAEILAGWTKHFTSGICQKTFVMYQPCRVQYGQTSKRPSRQMEKRKLIWYSSNDYFCQRTYPNWRRKAFAVESYSEVLWFGSNLFHDVVEELGLLFLFRQETIQKDQYTVSEYPIHRQTMTVFGQVRPCMLEHFNL